MEGEPTLDAPGVIAVVIFLGIIAGSIVLWIRQARRPAAPGIGAGTWPIGWINFGLFICSLIVVIVVFQNLGAYFIAGNADEAPAPIHTPHPDDPLETWDEFDYEAPAPELTPEIAIAAVLLLQLPILAVFLALRRAYPREYGGPLNRRSLSFGAALKETLPLFVMFLPTIWIAGMIWNLILGQLETRGWIDGTPPQELISLFAAGGHPVSIGILVLLAVGLAPLVEELIFRGGIYRFLKSQTPLIAAQVISGAFFAVIHGNLLSFGPLLVVGIILARVYERSGNILVPICFHGCFNAFSLFMLFLATQSEMIPT